MGWVLAKYNMLYDRWNRCTKKKKLLLFLGIYTLIFLCVSLLVYYPFFSEGRSFVRSGDGRTQHFPALMYIGRYWRAVILNLLHGKFSIPMFDLNLGVGMDVIGTLNWYGFGDPLTLLSVVVPAQYTEYLYNFLVILRIYMAGLSFCALCRYHGKSVSCSLVGAIIYMFCGYGICCSVMHPFFINPMIQLPLLILGVDQVLQKRRPYVFIAAVAYSALCGVYFLYMMTIAVGVYALICFFDQYRTNRVQEFLSLAGRGIGSYLLGICSVGPIFFPSVAGYLLCSRVGMSSGSDLLSYGWRIYLNNLLRTITPPGRGSWDALAMAAIVLLAIVFLFFRIKEHRTLFLLFVTAFAFFSVPLGGFIMNGFGYPSQRWTFCFSLLVAYITVDMLPDLMQLDGKKRWIGLAVLIVYAMAVFSSSQTRNAVYLVGVAMLACTLTVLLYFSNVECCQQKRQIVVLACLLLVIINVSVNALYRYAKDQGNQVSDFAKAGTETGKITTCVQRRAEPYLSRKDGRFDGSLFTDSSGANNYGMVWHVPSMSTYWSILPNAHITDFWEATENSSLAARYHITDSDYRTYTNALLSEKYFIEREDRTQYIPFGHEVIEQGTGKINIYENKYALPWGYTYRNVLSYEDFDGLNGIEVQEAMLQGIALEDKQSLFPKAEIRSDTKKIPCEFVLSKNMKWEDGLLLVGADGESITLNYEMPPQTEGYVRLKSYLPEDGTSGSFRQNFLSHEVLKRPLILTKNDRVYFGRESYLVCLGYSEEERNTCTITFPKKGRYQLEDIEVFAQSMDHYKEYVEELRSEPLESVLIEANHISGTIALSEDKVLCISIPYSRGWAAEVDGKKVDILRGNYMFIAIPLKSGSHSIHLYYCSPGLKLGVIAMAGSMVLLFYMVWEERKKRYI